MSYQRAAVSGFTWQTALKIVSSGLSFLKMVVLARLLTPNDMGMFSLVAIGLGLTEALTQTGVNITIVQSPRKIEYFLDTAWVIAIGRGFLIGIIMIALGLGMSQFYQQPALTFLVALAAVVPVIKGFINPAIVSVHKEMSFRADATYRFSLVLVETLTAVGLVWLYPNLVMWIVALIVTSVFEVVISFAFFRLRPQFRYLPDRAAAIFSRTKGLALSSVISYLNDNIDNLLIGKLAGTYGLGLYQNTYGLTHELNYEITKSVHHSALPIYSKLQGDSARLARAFFKTSGLGFLITLGASLPLFLFPEPLLLLVFGDQWLPAVPLVRWLIVAGIIHGIGMLCYSLLYARNQMKTLNFHLFLSFICMVLLIIFLGRQAGLVGAVIGLAVGRLLALPYLLLQLRKAWQN